MSAIGPSQTFEQVVASLLKKKNLGLDWNCKKELSVKPHGLPQRRKLCSIPDFAKQIYNG